jgi:predicted ATPase
MATRKRFDPRSALPGSPFLTHITLREDRVQPGVHPFTVPWLLPRLDLQLSAPVTFLVGENGTGKSTLLEAIAWSVGFGAQGGNRDQSFAENADGHALGRALRLSWRQKVSGGFFLRAETFFNFATYLEDVGSPFIAYGGKSLHQQSHGEAFLSLFQHRFEDGLYLLGHVPGDGSLPDHKGFPERA